MKTLFSLIACTLISTLAASGICPPCKPPCEKPCERPCDKPCEKPCEPKFNCCDIIYELGAAALFLQPNASNIYYAAMAIPFDPNIAVPAASPNWQIFENNPKYTFGFDVSAGFLFKNCNCLNFRVEWEHFQSKSSASTSVPLSTDMIGPLFDIGPNSELYKNASGQVCFKFDALDLVAAKRLLLCGDSFANIYTGAALASIGQTKQATYSNVAGDVSRTIKSPASFVGVGPKFGLDVVCRFCGCFAFTSNLNIALLMGQMKNSTTFTSYTPDLTDIGNPNPNVQTTTVPKRWQLVPGLNESLGFAYILACDCYNVTFGFGYLAQIYLNAIQSIDMTSQAVPTLLIDTPDIGVFAQGFTRTLSNFMLSGPYLSLALDF